MKNMVKILFALVIMAVVYALFDSLATEGVILGVITGGPLKDFKWGGITLRPTKDGEPEWETSGTNYEKSASPNGDSYNEGEARIGYVQQECAFSTQEWKEFKALQDADDRSGTATTQDSEVLSINGSIDGEHVLANGKATVKIAGAVRVQ